MAIQKQLTAVTLQLEVSNGVDKNDQPSSRTSAMKSWQGKPLPKNWRKWARNSAT